MTPRKERAAGKRTSLEERVRAEFEDLIDDGRLRVTGVRSDPQAFGNALVTLAGGGVLLRLVSDRGDIYAEIAREVEPDQWLPLQHAIAAVSRGSPAEGPFSVAGFADEVRRSWSKLTIGLGPDWEATKPEIDRLLELSRARFLERGKEISARAGRKRRK